MWIFSRRTRSNKAVSIPADLRDAPWQPSRLGTRPARRAASRAALPLFLLRLVVSRCLAGHPGGKGECVAVQPPDPPLPARVSAPMDDAGRLQLRLGRITGEGAVSGLRGDRLLLPELHFACDGGGDRAPVGWPEVRVALRPDGARTAPARGRRARRDGRRSRNPWRPSGPRRAGPLRSTGSS